MQEKLQILMVEDAEDDALLIARELRAAFAGIDLQRVDTEPALRAALDSAKRWDLVLSDYGLPGFSGMEALRLVKTLRPELPFILVTGTIGEEAAVAALKAGVNDYVLKASLARLPSAIERQLREAEERLERRRSERALSESEERFRQLAENLDSVFYLTDPANSEIYYLSPAYEKIWGRSLESIRQNPRAWYEAVHPEDRAAVADHLERAAAGPVTKRYRIVRPDGAVRWIRTRAFPVRDASGKPYRIAGIVEDETERKAAEDRIDRLNRVYSVLSSINSLIVRAPTRQELFKEACRIVVEGGQFRMAWLGLYDRDAMSVVPVASHGRGADIIGLSSLSLDDPRLQDRGLVRRAVRQKQPVIINDIEGDRKFRLREDALKRGFRSAAVLPLVVAGEIIGVLGLFSAEAQVFDGEEMKLLSQLAGDISFALDHLAKTERLDYLAYYDGLTGLSNRTLFLERLEQILHTASESGRKLALIACDLERFRAVNDSLGRQAGDLLLTRFAERLQGSVMDPHQLARLGADQFVVVLPDVRSELEAVRVLGELSARCFGEPFFLGATELRVSAKAGIALFPGNGAEPAALLANAEAALKRCKRLGERHVFFEEEMTRRVAENLSLETKLRRAIEREEFVLYYQPKLDASTGRTRGVEALIRWRSGDGLVPPMQFIPLLEETGLILEVGAWALSQAALEHKGWLEQGIDAPRVAVNVSAVQLRQRDFVSHVKRAIERGAQVPGLDLEVTESMVMDDVAGNVVKLRELRELGLDVAIDDFGTGHSSLSYITRLPVNSLKIDRAFIITMLEDANVMKLVRGIISLAHELKLKVIAEGVEREDQAVLLRELHCDELQGYLFSRPLPAAALVALLQNERRTSNSHSP
jgi:diguanylate cyclase (GGDEF)-like protein/PAS domain S-box-containing protein